MTLNLDKMAEQDVYRDSKDYGLPMAVSVDFMKRRSAFARAVAEAVKREDVQTMNESIARRSWMEVIGGIGIIKAEADALRGGKEGGA